MPYYCTVPQCTSLAGRAKDVSFHQFPRDEVLGTEWNRILKRNKPYTKYSKVCSRHFTSDDYTMTHMGKNKGQWKTLNKDAVPSQNLPKINADGSVMVIRKGRSPKYKNEDSDPNHSGLEDQPTLATLAKGYLASNSGGSSMKNESPSPWYSQDEQDEELEDEEDVKDVKVKEEYPAKRKVQTQDATIQTDLCQEGIGFRKSLLDPCPGYANYFPQPISDSTGMTNYFQTSTTEHLSLPKDPISMGQGQCVFGKPPFYSEPHYNSMLGQHAVKTNRNH